MRTDKKSKLLIEFMYQNNTLKEVVELLKSERSSSNLDYKSKFEENREQLSLMNQHKYGSNS
nr:hypothetical protein [uncultured Bacteroides sp.]